MPYIDALGRAQLDGVLTPLLRMLVNCTEGQVNYVLTRVVLAWVDAHDTPTYADYNAAIGTLECCKLELYRRRIAAYESAKQAQNGDVYCV